MQEKLFLTKMADGTLKQINPFTGTEVWTVPRRGNRPMTLPVADVRELRPEDHSQSCAFCSARYLETPPEKARIIQNSAGDFETLSHLPATELNQTTAVFRRVPNLFEILAFDYWRANYDYQIPSGLAAWRDSYLADPKGFEHTANIVMAKLKAAGQKPDMPLSQEVLLEESQGFFAGGHDVIIGQRHYLAEAKTTAELASSGTLSVAEHRAFLEFTVASAEDLLLQNRYARYITVFQNWLKPAGASFDHLHKQLVAIDERGNQQDSAIQLLRQNPNAFNDYAVNFAGYHNLVLAENENAIAFAGFGHRYPTIEIFSKSRARFPWEHSEEELRDVSDMIHAMHAATGADVPCNEEWHYRPIDSDVAMPWRVMLKWRISTLAGFEGATKIYLNTISPYTIRDRIVPKLFELRTAGKIAVDRIAFECDCAPNTLRYQHIPIHPS